MVCLNRQQFVDMFNALQEGLGGPNSPLWAFEDTGAKCEWFVCIKPLVFSGQLTSDFWVWCAANCKGRIICFSTNAASQEEWWGFSEHEDAMWWALKWSS